MFEDCDSLYDFDILSSPIPQREQSYPDFGFTTEQYQAPYFELQVNAEPSQQYFQSRQSQIDSFQYDLKVKQIRSDKIQKEQTGKIAPKKKKTPVVFKPFASFEATELTVRKLMSAI